MNNRSFSEEEMRQREKEERSRLRKQEQAYREAQRGVYSRIYQEQDAMPEDYRAAFWEDPRDRLYDQDRRAAQKGDDWAAERRQIQEELWDDPWPKSRGDRRSEPPVDPPRRPSRPAPPPQDREPASDEWQPLPELRPGGQKAPQRKRKSPPPAGGTGGRGGPPPRGAGGPPPRKRRRRKILVTVLLVLLALLAIGFVIHQIYVRPPDIPTHENQEAGTDPGSLGVGRREDVYTFLLVGRDDGQGGGGNTDTMMVGCYDVKNGTVDVLSIYRDTMVDVPGEIPKINSVYNRQGIEGVQKQIKNLIGYTPDY